MSTYSFSVPYTGVISFRLVIMMTRFPPLKANQKTIKSVTDGKSFVTGYMRQYAKNYKIHGSWMSIMSDVKNSACWLWFTDLPDFGVGGSYAVPDMVSLDTC